MPDKAIYMYLLILYFSHFFNKWYVVSKDSFDISFTSLYFKYYEV